MRQVTALVCVFLSLQCPAWANYPVIDISNLFQSTLQVLHLVEMISLTTRDLAPLAEVGKVMQVAADLQLVMREVNQIAGRMGVRQGLYQNIGVLPETAQGMIALHKHLTATCRAASQDGLSAQSLLTHASTLLGSLTQLLSSVQSILGAVAGLQSAHGAMAEISGHMALLHASTVSAHEGALCLSWAKAIRQQASEQLIERLMHDYGTIRER